MKVLVINSGSSSIKYQLIETNDENCLASGLIERVSLPMGIITHKKHGVLSHKDEIPVKDHQAGLDMMLKLLMHEKHGVIKNYTEINAIGHRVVHGGEKFTHSVMIDDSVMEALENSTYLAPLHNPANILGIKAARKLLPKIPNVAVFDTAFHQTMPKVAYIYSLPYEFYEKRGIRKYGFHGTSHQYVAQKAAETLGKAYDQTNVITCHLGNGCSLAAVKNGKSIDTSLGYGTMCGVVMGTRAGDIDPAIIVSMVEELNMTPADIKNVLYKKSGLLGLSGVSSDMRDIEKEEENGNERAKLALDVFADRVRKYIGAYAVTLGKVDAIVFTAGIGENGWEIRERICAGLEGIGAFLDTEKNKVRGKLAIISKEDSPVKIISVPTNEELMIAKETVKIVL
ncbi:acetate kinase [candidate division WOR-3 bacterium]|nr:acetate kinase [candidate division WOR-3 bacterium]